MQTTQPLALHTMVEAMAEYLGIENAEHAGLLWVAERCSVAPLPLGWASHTDEQGGVYYHHAGSGQTTWCGDDLYLNRLEVLLMAVMRNHLCCEQVAPAGPDIRGHPCRGPAGRWGTEGAVEGGLRRSAPVQPLLILNFGPPHFGTLLILAVSKELGGWVGGHELCTCCRQLSALLILALFRDGHAVFPLRGNG